MYAIRSYYVICPGFSADCLETLEEIAQEGRDDFLKAGGKAYHYIPALNDNPDWIAALADITENHLAGWHTRDQPNDASLTQEASEARRFGAVS